MICPFMPQLSLALIYMPTKGWPGWAELDGWLHTDMVCPSLFPAVTGPDYCYKPNATC